MGAQTRRRDRRSHARRAECRARLSRAPAGDRDGAVALAAAQRRRRRGSTSTPPPRSSTIGATGSMPTTTPSSRASPTNRPRSFRRRSSASSPSRPGTCPKASRRQGAGDQEPRLACGQRLRPEGRQVGPAVGAEELARPGQVRHGRQGGDLPPRHAGQGAVRHARAPPQPRLRPRRECDPIRDRARAGAGHSRPVPARR